MNVPPRCEGSAPAPINSDPTWSPGSKDAVGTALGKSRLWFTVAQGIITELYHPRPDIPQLKDLGFIIADGAGFWVEVRRLASYTVSWFDEAVPAITIIHSHSRFTLTLKICVDPIRDVLLVDFSLSGVGDLHLYVVAAPRIGEDATRNYAWADEWAGRPVLWAEQGPFGLAIAVADRDGASGFLERSVGLVGASDGWQDIDKHGAMRWHYANAGPGEVALSAQLVHIGTLALGLSSSREAAATLALQSLASGFEAAWFAYCDGWQHWLQGLTWPHALVGLTSESRVLLRRSAAVIKCHEDRTFPGAYVASLSIPWGESNNSRGGYHLVWARDLVETAGALVALGCLVEARNILIYLIGTQQADGHWLQNQWLGGKPFWLGIQLDETAFPVLLASALAEQSALANVQVTDMIRRALRFVAKEGPATSQDRWEEDTGLNTFTLAIAIAALVEGSRFLEGHEAECALMLADVWNASLERWTWASNTQLALTLGVPGYYMRSAPEHVLLCDEAKHEALSIKNSALAFKPAADEQIAIDCLQLARYGLRAMDSPTMVASVKVIDTALKTETPNGPVWHRYNGDGYGEHADGMPFNGWGKGRGWPLLTGERGHAALLAGEDVRPYINAMAQMTGEGGLLPEQVWDTEAIPLRGLYPGRPTGSAMPLVWAHAEFIKLALSFAAGVPVDRPARTWARYQAKPPKLDYVLWQLRQRVSQLLPGEELRLLLPEPAQVHWGINGWRCAAEAFTEDWGLGHVVKLPTRTLVEGDTLEFTFYWLTRGEWQGEDFRVSVVLRS